MISKTGTFIAAVTATLLLGLTPAHANNINLEVAEAYNNGLVRCGNRECAEYLYACFQSYRSSSLQEFLECGALASRLNNGQVVVLQPPV